VNHVRAKLRTGFLKAKKAALWIGPNPIIETEPRRVPRLVHPTLRIEDSADRDRRQSLGPGLPLARWLDALAGV